MNYFYLAFNILMTYRHSEFKFRSIICVMLMLLSSTVFASSVDSLPDSFFEVEFGFGGLSSPLEEIPTIIIARPGIGVAKKILPSTYLILRAHYMFGNSSADSIVIDDGIGLEVGSQVYFSDFIFKNEKLRSKLLLLAVMNFQLTSYEFSQLNNPGWNLPRDLEAEKGINREFQVGIGLRYRPFKWFAVGFDRVYGVRRYGEQKATFFPRLFFTFQ